jgi:hypothetical protein
VLFGCLALVHSCKWKCTLAFRGIYVPVPPKQRTHANNWPPPPQNNVLVFLLFVFFAATLRCSLQLPEHLPTDSKTCSRCVTISTLLPTEGSDRRILIIRATPRICEIANYEPVKSEGWLYIQYVRFKPTKGWDTFISETHKYKLLLYL